MGFPESGGWALEAKTLISVVGEAMLGSIRTFVFTALKASSEPSRLFPESRAWEKSLYAPGPERHLGLIDTGRREAFARRRKDAEARVRAILAAEPAGRFPEGSRREPAAAEGARSPEEPQGATTASNQLFDMGVNLTAQPGGPT